MQRLAYGTWLVIAARNVERERLGERTLLEAAQRLAAAWPLGAAVQGRVLGQDGPTHAVAGPRGSLLLHAFPGEEGLVVAAFCVGEVSPARFVERVEQIFGLSVYDLQSGRYGALLPQNRDVFERLLLGERFMARARLVPTLD